MKKVTIKKHRQTKVFKLSEEQLNDIQNSPNFERIKNNLMLKAEKNIANQTYFKKSFWREFLIIAFSAFMTTIAFDYFISSTGRTGLFPGGLGSVTRFLALISFPDSEQKQGSFYFIYYFLINIPLMIFGYFKIGPKFTLTTFIWVVLSIAFDQIIQIIPIINPKEWHIIIDYQLISMIPMQWNSMIWLFVFAIVAGGFIGWSYSIVYKVGSSTGGTDFITMFYSQKKNKNIGSINRNVNFGILAVIIVLNTVLLKTSDMNETFKISILNNLNPQAINQNGEFFTNVNIWWTENQQYIFDPSLMNGSNHLSLNEIFSDRGKYDVFIKYLASDNTFSGYTASMMALMKFKFIFGPSLFASIVLLLIQGLTINNLYPKYKARTILITTTKAEEVEKFLFDSGYKNDVLIWDTQSYKKPIKGQKSIINKKMIIITITVVNWKQLEKGIMNIDDQLNVNTLRTRTVKGPFNVDLKDERQQEFIHNKLINNPKLLKKINDEAIEKTIKRNEKQLKKQKILS